MNPKELLNMIYGAKMVGTQDALSKVESEIEKSFSAGIIAERDKNFMLRKLHS